MNSKYIIRKTIVGIVLLSVFCSSTALAAESKSVEPGKVELNLPAEIITSTSEDLDPTEILNMTGILPENSEITALNKVPAGAGSVLESESTGDTKIPEGKEFYVIETGDEQVFYLIIDHAKSADNVYFLSRVNTDDVMQITENTANESAKEKSPIEEIWEDENKTADLPAESSEADNAEDTAGPGTVEDKNNETGSSILMILIVICVLAVGYYLKIYKPKKKVLDDALDLEDFEGIENDYPEEDFSNQEEDETNEVEDIYEEEEEEPEERPQKSKQKAVAGSRKTKVSQQPVKRATIHAEPSKPSFFGNIIGLLGKIVFGTVLVGLVSLGLTVLTNENLRTIIMETIKNYF